MKTVVNMYQAKTQLSKLVKIAQDGGEVVIAKAGVPQVKLVVVEDKALPIDIAGSLKGKIRIPDNFDDEDDALNYLFYGDTPK